MAAANSQNGNSCRASEPAKDLEYLRLVVIKIAQSPTKNNGIRLKLGAGPGQIRKVSYFGGGVFYQTPHIRGNVFQGHCGNLPLTFELERSRGTPFPPRHVRKVSFVTQEIVDNQDPRGFDSLLNRLIEAEGPLIERKRTRIPNVRRLDRFVNNLGDMFSHLR